MSIGSPSVGKGRQAKCFLQRPSAKKAGDLLDRSRNHLRIMTGLQTGHLFKMRLVDGPRWVDARETSSHVFHDCEALAV